MMKNKREINMVKKSKEKLLNKEIHQLLKKRIYFGKSTFASKIQN